MTNTPSGGRKSLGFAGSCPAAHPKTPAADDLGPRLAGDLTQRLDAANGKNLTWGESAPIRLEHTAGIELPLRIESVANKREHWGKRAARAKAHRNAAVVVPVVPLPCTVWLMRVAPRKLDDDNLQSGFKALRDGISDRLGVKDNDPRVTWRYAQVRGEPKQYAVQITLHW